MRFFKHIEFIEYVRRSRSFSSSCFLYFKYDDIIIWCIRSLHHIDILHYINSLDCFCQESSTFRTFAGTIDAISVTRPLWVILENVDMGDSSDDDSNSAIVAKILLEAGYETRNMVD